ncbi:uncharacterized protein LOC118187892 [Stegodyphus dumicola]|uniref:uncharacterized protein LOC118187892 n=1 Tax=Stegodyphus dumicola TaxID=202533 RepID=UPI0015AC4137|nr:uncharacterized protein LOC118187892 [Stegodyphus dumicola]
MEINYFANVPLEGIPNTITGLRDLVRNFEQHVKKVNNGWGVPAEVELSDLSMYDRGLHIKNAALDAELQFFEEYFDDLLTTKSRFNSWMRTLPDELNPNDEKMIADFIGRLSKILRKFIETISQLNSEKGPEQLNGAKNAYKEGKGLGMAGKFRKELNKLMKKIVVPKTLLDDPSVSIYMHYGSSDCAAVESASTLYPGYLTSSIRNSTGNGYNYLCLPKSPDENTMKTYTGAKNQSFLAGVKYGFMENKPFPFDDEDTMLRGVVCAACLMNETQTVFTFHGQKECPDQEGWRAVYGGYLMSPTDVSRGETICVDKKLESHADSYMGFYDQSLNFVLRKQEGELLFIPCVVCAK